jgi:RsiW-degrading membrane proteinase PrsW (M82 family)
MLCTLLLVIGFFSCFLTDRRVPEYMWNTIAYIVMTGLGFTGIENITNFFKKPNQDGQ